jgi:peroxiredoxin
VVASPYVGYVAPDFAVKSVNGETIKLNDLRGKVVLLAFFGISS